MRKFAQKTMKQVTYNKRFKEECLFSDSDFESISDDERRKATVQAVRSTKAEQASSAQQKRDMTPLFERLAKSEFRSRFHLKAADREYIERKGLDTIRRHAEDFVRKRLAPAVIPNDGKQTPMRGHPVFLAQHATACCCRGCFQKWHGIPSGRELTAEEQQYAVDVIMEWIRRQYKSSHFAT